MKRIRKYTAEKLGFSLSLLCAIHCLATPFLITLLPFFGKTIFANPIFELGMLLASMILALSILIKSYKKHFQPGPLLVSLCGFCLAFSAQIGVENIVMSVLGSMLVAYAYYLNWKVAHVCKPTKVNMVEELA